MKLSIEIELQPDEIALATELFAILKSLTKQVKPKNTGVLFKQLISKIEDPSKLDAIANDVGLLFKVSTRDHYSTFDKIIFY